MALLATSAARAAPITIVAVGTSHRPVGFYVATEHGPSGAARAMLRAPGVDGPGWSYPQVSFDVTAGMLARIDQAVPDGTNITIVGGPAARASAS